MDIKGLILLSSMSSMLWEDGKTQRAMSDQSASYI